MSKNKRNQNKQPPYKKPIKTNNPKKNNNPYTKKKR